MKRAAVLIISLLLAVPVYGAGKEISFNKEAFIASAGVEKELDLGMRDCVELALKNNSEIIVVSTFPLIQDANVKIQKARFEPDISAFLMKDDNVEQSTIPLFSPDPSKTKTGIFDFGYDQFFITGTKLELDFMNTWSWTNSAITDINPYYDSKAQVTVTQPILKNFGILVNKAGLMIAKNDKLKSEQEFLRGVIAVLTEVKKSYYDFQYMQELYDVATASYDRTNNLYAINQERYTKGLASDVDVLESESEVAKAEEGVLAAERQVKLTGDNLKLITNLVDDPEMWNAQIKPLDKLDYVKKETDLVGSILKAFEHRPDYEAARIGLRNRDINVAVTKNGLLPTVDLIGSYALNGLDKKYGKDLGRLGSGNYPEWTAGVMVSVPLGNEEEKGNYDKAKLDKKIALTEFKRLEQKIILEVRDAVRLVDTKYKMIEAALKSKKAEERNYAAQEERFKAGLVSTHDMLDYHERLTRAEANFIKSVTDYNLALAELDKAEGTTLLNENIVLKRK